MGPARLVLSSAGRGVEFGERAIEAVRREIREEFGAEIRDVRLLGTLENIFAYHGTPGHEIVFVFETRFVDGSYYKTERVMGTEGDGIQIEAIWVDVSEPLDRPLYPEGLLELLDNRAGQAALGSQGTRLGVGPYRSLAMAERLPSYARIRPLALAVFRSGSRILVEDKWDRPEPFYRPPGGGVEFGERGIEAVRREMREEFDAEITEVRPLGTLESIFDYRGRLGHEIVLAFETRFADEDYYAAERIIGTEGSGSRIEAIWIDVSEPLDRPLYPNGLLELLQDSAG